MIAPGRRSKCSRTSSSMHLVGNVVGVEGLNGDGGGFSDADGVGDEHLQAVGETGGDQVLGHVAGRVGAGAVNLGRVLAGESAAAVPGDAAVGVHQDLAAGEAGVALGAADHEPAAGVDEVSWCFRPADSRERWAE